MSPFLPAVSLSALCLSRADLVAVKVASRIGAIERSVTRGAAIESSAVERRQLLDADTLGLAKPPRRRRPRQRRRAQGVWLLYYRAICFAPANARDRAIIVVAHISPYIRIHGITGESRPFPRISSRNFAILYLDTLRDSSHLL